MNGHKTSAKSHETAEGCTAGRLREMYMAKPSRIPERADTSSARSSGKLRLSLSAA